MASETEPAAADQMEATAALNALIEEIVAGRVSVMEVMRSAPAGDYLAFVQQARLSRMLITDIRVLERLMIEMREKMVEAGADPDNRDIDKELARKDGARRFPKLLEERTDAINTQPSLLTAATFPERWRNTRRSSPMSKSSGPMRASFSIAATSRWRRSCRSSSSRRRASLRGWSKN